MGDAVTFILTHLKKQPVSSLNKRVTGFEQRVVCHHWTLTQNPDVAFFSESCALAGFTYFILMGTPGSSVNSFQVVLLGSCMVSSLCFLPGTASGTDESHGPCQLSSKPLMGLWADLKNQMQKCWHVIFSWCPPLEVLRAFSVKSETRGDEKNLFRCSTPRPRTGETCGPWALINVGSIGTVV